MRSENLRNHAPGSALGGNVVVSQRINTVARHENIADQTNKHYFASVRNHQGRARLAVMASAGAVARASPLNSILSEQGYSLTRKNRSTTIKLVAVGIIKRGSGSMRVFIIVIAMLLTALASGSTAIAQNGQPAPAQPTQDQAAAEKQNPSWYRESAPYRPCPTVAAINGRNICLGCPGRCPWPPSFGK
jgi:hypothetical protein